MFPQEGRVRRLRWGEVSVAERGLEDDKLPRASRATLEHSQNPVAYRYRPKGDLDSELPETVGELLPVVGRQDEDRLADPDDPWSVDETFLITRAARVEAIGPHASEDNSAHSDRNRPRRHPHVVRQQYEFLPRVSIEHFCHAIWIYTAI